MPDSRHGPVPAQLPEAGMLLVMLGALKSDTQIYTAPRPFVVLHIYHVLSQSGSLHPHIPPLILYMVTVLQATGLVPESHYFGAQSDGQTYGF